MFTTWPKRTKVMLGIASGLLVIAIALGSGAIRPGKLKLLPISIGFQALAEAKFPALSLVPARVVCLGEK